MADNDVTTSEFPKNFIHDIIEDDLEAGKHETVVTRFPPEPNGYLHLGHATSIVLNFETAKKYGGRCHLRFDDTNPLTEEREYVQSIQEDVRWLGYDWGEHLYFASDYFEKMYAVAVHLIETGEAYVDSLDMETMREYRGTVTEAGKESPYRERSVEENLELFEGMRNGEFEDGEHVLRAKIDMGADNMLMRDPLLYRIRHATHHNTADQWCIYPMYDFAHCLEDAFEGVTHSLCTLEFENNRAIYDWVIDRAPKALLASRPRQYEFARRNLSHTITSKRKLLRLVEEEMVEGWNDPRLPTLAGLRRRGVPPSAIRTFCMRMGISKSDNRVDYAQLDHTIRDDLNMKAPRVMGVLEPLKVVITNYEQDKVEWLEAPYYPHDVPLEGSRKVPFSRELYIEREDFQEEPPEDWYRLAPGQEVRLRYGYYITCDEVIRGEDGQVKELRCSYDPKTKGGSSPDGREVKGTLHWVSAGQALECEVRLYERLFEVDDPTGQDETDYVEFVNPESLEVIEKSLVEPSVAGDKPSQRYQFERQGYFWRDPFEAAEEELVFNRIVSLSDSWARKQKEKQKAEDERRRREKEEQRLKALEAQRKAGPSDPISEERTRAREADEALADAFARYQEELGLKKGEADLLTGDRETWEYFEAVLSAYDAPSSVAPWVVNEVLARVDEGEGVEQLGLNPEDVGALIEMVDGDRINTQVSREVLEEMLESGGDPESIVDEKGLEKVGDASELIPIIEQAMEENPEEVEKYRGGKKRMIGYFIGQVMQATQGAADAVKVRELLQEKLEE